MRSPYRRRDAVRPIKDERTRISFATNCSINLLFFRMILIFVGSGGHVVICRIFYGCNYGCSRFFSFFVRLRMGCRQQMGLGIGIPCLPTFWFFVFLFFLFCFVFFFSLLPKLVECFVGNLICISIVRQHPLKAVEGCRSIAYKFPRISLRVSVHVSPEVLSTKDRGSVYSTGHVRSGSEPEVA